MQQDDQPQITTERFWTGGMIALAAINVVFLLTIITLLWLISGRLWPLVTAWIHNKFGV